MVTINMSIILICVQVTAARPETTVNKKRFRKICYFCAVVTRFIRVSQDVQFLEKNCDFFFQKSIWYRKSKHSWPCHLKAETHYSRQVAFHSCGLEDLARSLLRGPGETFLFPHPLKSKGIAFVSVCIYLCLMNKT